MPYFIPCGFGQTNKDDDNALMRAARSSNKETVELILNTAIAKLSPDEFKTFLTQTNKTQANKFSNIDLISATQNDIQRIHKKIVLEQIKKIVVVPAIAAIGAFGGLAVALNSISENPVPWVPDLLPDYPEQVTNKKNFRVPEPPN